MQTSRDLAEQLVNRYGKVAAISELEADVVSAKKMVKNANTPRLKAASRARLNHVQDALEFAKKHEG